MPKIYITLPETRIKIPYSHHALVHILSVLLHKNYNFMRVSHRKIIIIYLKNAQKLKYNFVYK